MKKEKGVIYTKYFEHIVLLTILNVENVTYAPIKKKTVNVFPKNIVQHAQLKKENMQIIKNYLLNVF